MDSTREYFSSYQCIKYTDKSIEFDMYVSENLWTDIHNQIIYSEPFLDWHNNIVKFFEKLEDRVKVDVRSEAKSFKQNLLNSIKYNEERQFVNNFFISAFPNISYLMSKCSLALESNSLSPETVYSYYVKSLAIKGLFDSLNNMPRKSLYEC